MRKQKQRLPLGCTSQGMARVARIRRDKEGGSVGGFSGNKAQSILEFQTWTFQHCERMDGFRSSDVPVCGNCHSIPRKLIRVLCLWANHISVLRLQVWLSAFCELRLTWGGGDTWGVLSPASHLLQIPLTFTRCPHLPCCGFSWFRNLHKRTLRGLSTGISGKVFTFSSSSVPCPGRQGILQPSGN